MRNVRFVVWGMVMFFVLAVTAPAGAQGRDDKFRHADKNKDGLVDYQEIKKEKDWEKQQDSKVNTWWEKQADSNNDGTVTADEKSSWKALCKERIDLNGDGVIDDKEKRLCWRNARSKVNTGIEKKYDANADGWLQEAEVKTMLQDRAQLIKTNGKAKVDSPIEENYDANGDGVLDGTEAQAMMQDAR